MNLDEFLEVKNRCHQIFLGIDRAAILLERGGQDLKIELKKVGLVGISWNSRLGDFFGEFSWM